MFEIGESCPGQYNCVPSFISVVFVYFLFHLAASKYTFPFQISKSFSSQTLVHSWRRSTNFAVILSWKPSNRVRSARTRVLPSLELNGMSLRACRLPVSCNLQALSDIPFSLLLMWIVILMWIVWLRSIVTTITIHKNHFHFPSEKTDRTIRNRCSLNDSQVRTGNFRPVVLNLGSIEPQGFGELDSGVRRQEILRNKSKINKIDDTYLIFPATKDSMNACTEIMGFSTSNKVNNHCIRHKINLFWILLNYINFLL